MGPLGCPRGQEGGALIKGLVLLLKKKKKEVPESSLDPCAASTNVSSWLSRRGLSDQAGTRVSNLKPADLTPTDFCGFQATRSVLLCYSSPNTPSNLDHHRWICLSFNKEKTDLGAKRNCEYILWEKNVSFNPSNPRLLHVNSFQGFHFKGHHLANALTWIRRELNEFNELKWIILNYT